MKIKLILGYTFITILFFLWKFAEIKDFDTVKGKVIAVEKIAVKECPPRGGRCRYINKYLSVIEFYYNQKRMEFSDGSDAIYNSLHVGDEVGLFVESPSGYKVKVNNLFFYWLTIPDLIIIGLLLIMYTGTIKVFFNN